MILARVDTTYYRFEALAPDEEEASRLMFEAWRNHCAENPRADPFFMIKQAQNEDINFFEIEIGQVLRDGERIV